MAETKKHCGSPVQKPSSKMNYHFSHHSIPDILALNSMSPCFCSLNHLNPTVLPTANGPPFWFTSITMLIRPLSRSTSASTTSASVQRSICRSRASNSGFMGFPQKEKRQETPNSVAEVKGECDIMLVMVLMLIMMLMMVMMLMLMMVMMIMMMMMMVKTMMVMLMVMILITDDDDDDDEDDDGDDDDDDAVVDVRACENAWARHKRHRKWPRTPPLPAFCAQRKCTRTCQKRHFVRKITWKMPDANHAASILHEPAQSKCTWTCHKRHFVRKITWKMPDANHAASILREPAQSKCTWTCHKKHLARRFTEKMPNAPDTTSIEHWALTVTVRSPQCGHTVWGTMENLNF